MADFKHALSVGLAAATLSVVLTYALGAEAILQSPYAEPGHELFMSIYAPLIQGITGGHSSMSQLHGGGPATDSQMQRTMGPIGNNMLGVPTGPAAAGFGAVVVMGAIAFATSAFVISRKQRSFVVAGLLPVAGVILMILPLASMNFAIPGPIIGVAVGFAILGLGLAKGLRDARTAVAVAR